MQITMNGEPVIIPKSLMTAAEGIMIEIIRHAWKASVSDAINLKNLTIDLSVGGTK